MGRLLGSLAEVDELDRPDLNKCPDCKCFFASEKCPLCGKVCPEEMRAGNRKKEKKSRTKSGSGRVRFIEWYHSWWFILIMMFTFTPAGIVLLITSPRAKWKKILFCTLAVLYLVIPAVNVLNPGGIYGFIYGIKASFEKPVDTTLSEQEYKDACQYVKTEDFYRTPSEYKGSFLRLELTVSKRVWYYDGYFEAEDPYYLCTSEDGRFSVIIRDCVLSDEANLVAGDIVSVYGEGADTITVYDTDGNSIDAPCINTAYIVFVD